MRGMTGEVDIAVVGAGAAGLMAAIAAGRARPGLSVVALDGARRLGAKILVSGGGRCNVTHDVVDETAFAGAPHNAIRKVLRRFDVAATVAFFRARGVELKREETGKLFPTTDRARTVLDALLGAAQAAGVGLRHPCRVEEIARHAGGFVVGGGWGRIAARRVVLATGGQSLPKSGSDGGGYALASALGHTVTPRLQALVPLVLPPGHFLLDLKGVSLPARLEVRLPSGRVVASFTDATLLTHFGLSGPATLDVSRHLLAAQAEDPGARLVASWLPDEDAAAVDERLRTLGARTPAAALAEALPQRMARALCVAAGVAPDLPGAQLAREARRALVRLLVAHELEVTGPRGWTYAEVTAGGVPLSELRLETLESRPAPGLHLCGEVCDVDGRIGGYNFQWAWASGHVAGTGAAGALA
jgi:predicted Rossmann fold flavoprotein